MNNGELADSTMLQPEITRKECPVKLGVA